jgi:tetratricopeptide (TPR) repeat protein
MSLAVADFTAPSNDVEAMKYAGALRQDVVTGIGAVEQRVSLHSAGAGANGAGKSGRADARYELRGDVRRRTDNLVANLSLIDVQSGAQPWAGTFALPDVDRSERSPVALRNLVRSVADAVSEAERRRVVALPVDRLDADELVIRGAAQIDVATLANARKAKDLYDSALRLDPNNVRALRARAIIVTFENEVDPNADPQRMAQEFDEFSARALALNRTDSVSWNYRCGALQYLGQWTAAAEACDQTIRLDPYSAKGYVAKAWLLISEGRPSDALTMTAKAMELDPDRSGWALDTACRAYLLLSRTHEAIETCEKTVGQDPFRWSAHLLLVAAYTEAGLPERAAAAKASVDRIVPDLTIARIRAQYAEHPDAVQMNERYLYEPMRRAGIPEK